MNQDLTIPEKTPIATLRECRSLIESFTSARPDLFSSEEKSRLRSILRRASAEITNPFDDKGLHGLRQVLLTAATFAEAVEADRNILLAILLATPVEKGILSRQEVTREWSEDVAGLIDGLINVRRFADKNDMAAQENFRGLILSLADDIRVIIIMIVRSLVLMRSINHHPDEAWVRGVAFEANCLYAQLAHRLGLYKIKGELEDLSLKYTNREIYTQIARKLNETKRERDAYIVSFIEPLKKKLLDAGLKFDIKGRTKSISSIWAKMKKQKVDIDRIYDLFAIRVILDSEPEKEKSECWLAYSILADMYTPNPKRMRDWISIPKSNGYESLHATVIGPESKWVEVQFRTRRMDLVAEKGLAAHWRYKGVKSDSTDQWMNNIRDILESAQSGPMELMRDMKMDLYTKEVYAFTPKGDLFRLPAGATVLDFAFMIHSNIGAHCTGAIVNDTHRRLTYRIESGDTVEILTSATQSPKPEWLNMVVSPKSRNKIKQKLNEQRQHLADLGKELIERRAKNRKIELNEAHLMKLIKKNGYKFVSEFYADVADNKVDPGNFLNEYLEFITPPDNRETLPHTSAEEFRINHQNDDENARDVLVIGEKAIDGLKYKFSRCCNPVYGDNVFGFISSDGVVKIHRHDCPNAADLKKRYPYRLIRVDWSGKQGEILPVAVKIVGTDDIGIIANITSIISKEPNVTLRNISVDSHDGLFQGYLTLGVSDNSCLNAVLKKIKTVKGVKDATRN